MIFMTPLYLYGSSLQTIFWSRLDELKFAGQHCLCLSWVQKVVFENWRSFWNRGLCEGTDIPKGLSLAPWSRPCIQENWSLSQLVSCLQFCCWMHHSTHISLLLTFRKIMWQGRDLLKAWLRPFSLDCICCLQVKWFPWRRIFHLVSFWDKIS